MMVVLNATDGKILANLSLTGGSDGAVFNPATMDGSYSDHEPRARADAGDPAAGRARRARTSDSGFVHDRDGREIRLISEPGRP